MSTRTALLENRRAPKEAFASYLLSDCIAEYRSYNVADLEHSLNQLTQAQQAGHYALCLFSYEAGYALEKKLQSCLTENSKILLCHIVIFRRCDALNQSQVEQWLQQQLPVTPSSHIEEMHFNLSEADYLYHLQHIKQHLQQGDSYQINYTGQYHFHHQGEPISLYARLRVRQPVEYGVYFDAGDYQVLSFSPELFFKKTQSRLMCKPMKGTALRDADPVKDQHNLQQLLNNKNCTENVIIVDLLRNDMALIAKTGSVVVEHLFQVEVYQTLYQLTSTIVAEVDPELPLYSILRALFPCGSITGAPKLRSMQIIHEHERQPRGIYTGAIGLVMPNNDMCFNVPIRTIRLTASGEGELGVGSGIVYDSDPQEEWQETHWKARFFTMLDIKR